MEWISTKEQLPDHPRRRVVFVCPVDADDPNKGRRVLIGSCPRGVRDEFQSDDGSYWYGTTHWLPVPPLPPSEPLR